MTPHDDWVTVPRRAWEQARPLPEPFDQPSELARFIDQPSTWAQTQLRRFSYKPKFTADYIRNPDEYMPDMIVFKATVPDVRDPTQEIVIQGRVVVPLFFDEEYAHRFDEHAEEEFARWLRHEIDRFERHETSEWLRRDGVAIFDPHKEQQ